MKTTLLLSALLVFALACQRGEKGINPTYKDLTEAVYASGNVLPRDEYILRADADGTLQQRLVDEGDTVRKGQLLFVLESAAEDARWQAASAVLRQSQANLQTNSPVLAELENQVRNARTRLRNDSVNYTRFRELYAQNATSKAELERAELNYTLAQNTLRAQQSALQRTRNQLGVDVANSRSQLVTTEVAGSNTRIRSFVDGKIYEVYKDPGELVRPGDQLALIGSGRRLFAQLAVDESDFGRIRVGQEVVIRTDAYGERVFKAQITKVYPKLNRADQSFRADAEFIDGQPDAYYGLTVEANVIISQNRRVLTIPKTYVFGSDSVWVEQDGKKQKIRIRKGAENFDLVEVKGGLTEQSVILASD